MNKVSVIIPTYNRCAELMLAINSVLNQTYEVHEILVCDDGSTDNSQQCIFELNNDKVKWIDCGRNGMPSIPRNKGMKIAEGNWFAFLDSDDSWLPKKIETQLALAETMKTSAVSCNAFRIDANGINHGPYQRDIIPERITTNHLLKTNLVICSSALIKRSVCEKAIGFPESKSMRAIEDYAFWLRISTMSDFAYSSECFVNYRDDASTSIRSDDDDTWRQRERIFIDFHEWCKNTEVDKKYVLWSKSEVKRAMKMNGVGVIKRWMY